MKIVEVDDGMTQQGPTVPRDREKAERTARVQLRQATWEATQFMSYDEVREYVEMVFREVQSDEV